MADNNIISSSKKEIYSKMLDIASKYVGNEDEYLKTGLFGYITESMAMMMRDSTFHKSMLYNESFLNSAVIPKSVYNWAKMFNIEVQKATPAYADIDIEIDRNSLDLFLKDYSGNYLEDEEKYNISNIHDYLILDRESPILAGDHYFSLERSILIYKNNDVYMAKYCSGETTATNFEENVSLIRNCRVEGSGNLVIRARAYQYKQVIFNERVSSDTFLNKTKHYTFEGQFCGAKLFYAESDSRKVEVELKYSEISNNLTTKKIGFYNLSDENELELLFKNGNSYYMPSANSRLILYVFTTEGSNISSMFTGDALIQLNNADLKALPIVIHFVGGNVIGGKNMPTISEIKQTIVNEISTRNVITTTADLNNYFQILTQLIDDINNGRVTFIKKRDDIIKRVFNAYLLLRNNTDDITGEESAANYLPACVPTNTINVSFQNEYNSIAESSVYQKDNFISNRFREAKEDDAEDDIYKYQETKYVKDPSGEFIAEKVNDESKTISEPIKDSNYGKRYKKEGNKYILDNSGEYCKIPTNIETKDFESITLRYPIFDENGNYKTDSRGLSGYYISPFYIYAVKKPIKAVKYIYNMTEDSSPLNYYDTVANSFIENEPFKIDNKQYYIVPTSFEIERGFSDGPIESSDVYTFKLLFQTNFSMNPTDENALTLDTSSASSTLDISVYEDNPDVDKFNIPVSNITVVSEATSDNDIYNTTFTFTIKVDTENEFRIISNNQSQFSNNYCNKIYLKNGVNDIELSQDNTFVFKLDNLFIKGQKLSYLFKADKSVRLFTNLDELMESDLLLGKLNVGTELMEVISGLSEVPVVHSSFFKENKEIRKKGFVNQLFRYIETLEENLDRLETTTFFNLKFYNTYGYSKLYSTPRTNIDLTMDISLIPMYNKDEYDDLKNEIRSYVRRIVDRMNEDGNGIKFSTISSMLSSANTYGKYIDHISFIGLNGSFTQYINPLDQQATLSIENPPEWLNLDPDTLEANITFNQL